MDLSENKNAKYRHPWELSRTDMILDELERLGVKGEVLDIGCGDGYFDKKLLRRFPSITNIWGVDIHAEKSVHKGKEHYVNAYKDIRGGWRRVRLHTDDGCIGAY